MISLFNDIVDEVARAMAVDMNGKVSTILLGAYNYWTENERDGADYIFDIDNWTDVKYLVKNDLITTDEIVRIVGEKDHLFLVNDTSLDTISSDKAHSIIKANLVSIVRCMFKYVGDSLVDSPYGNLYDEYVGRELREYTWPDK